MSFIRASGLGPLTASNTATIVDPATPASGSATLGPLVSYAAKDTSTGAVLYDFIGIPSWAKRITLVLSGVSTNGTSLVQTQIGAGSITTSGYIYYGSYAGATNGAGGVVYTSGIVTDTGITGNASNLRQGILTIVNVSGNTWTYSYSGSIFYAASNYYATIGAGSITLSGILDRVRLTTVNGTDTFDAGSVNVMYE